MIKEAIGYGETLEEARENAIIQLNASELDDIQFDVVAMPKKKVLGMFGGNKAQVRAFIEIEDKKPAVKKEKAAKKEKTAEKKAETKAEPKKEKPAKTEVKAKEAAREPIVAVSESELAADSPAKKAIDYIKTVLATLECGEVKFSVAQKDNGALIILDGEDLSILIGRRGETLDAVQYLASLAANNGGGHYRVSLNIGNYREKREETLVQLANKIAAQVIKTSKSRSLEPMNPYERRIIHTAVQAIDGVYSASVGEGNSRRVVIALEGAEIKPTRYNDRRNDRHRSRGPRKPSNKVTNVPAREPKKDSDIPLYGKIN